MQSSRHTWIVDVIEEDSAAVEVDGKTVTPVPRWMLPAGAKQGDVLTVLHERKRLGSRLTIVVDREATAAAYRQSEAQVAEAGRSGGNVDL